MGRATRAMTAVIAGAIAVVVVVLGSPAGAGASSRPSQDATVPAPATTVPVTTAATDASGAAADDGSSEVGDPAADRRIRRIVIGLCAVAGLVLAVTVLFWRATRPVPRALQGLRAMGSRSGRRQAAAASGPSSAPASGTGAPALVPAAGTASLPDDG